MNRRARAALRRGLSLTLLRTVLHAETTFGVYLPPRNVMVFHQIQKGLDATPFGHAIEVWPADKSPKSFVNSMESDSRLIRSAGCERPPALHVSLEARTLDGNRPFFRE